MCIFKTTQAEFIGKKSYLSTHNGVSIVSCDPHLNKTFLRFRPSSTWSLFFLLAKWSPAVDAAVGPVAALEPPSKYAVSPSLYPYMETNVPVVREALLHLHL